MKTVLRKRFCDHWILAAICLGYLGLTIIYSVLVPAWEANDEMDHVANVEYFLEHGTFIPLSTLPWHETHQPPLYYMLCAGWQRVLGIPAFTPTDPARRSASIIGPPPGLAYTHIYTPAQHSAAVAVHKLRLLSMLLGLGTVVLTYSVGLLSTARKEIALSAAGFVAFLPKFNVISAAVTNDSLVVLLCSLALLLAVLYQKLAAETKQVPAGILIGLGMTTGAAVITKLTSLPVICFLMAFVLLVPLSSLSSRLRAFGLALLGLFLTCGWWLSLNYLQQGGLLGQRGALEWLSERSPGLVSVVPWTDRPRFFTFVPSHLSYSMWYDGGWNQFIAPFALNLLPTIVAAISGFGVARAFVNGGVYTKRFDPVISLLAACSLAGAAAVLILARISMQAEGRIAYVGLSSFAVLVVLGLAELFGGSRRRLRLALWIWPAVLLGFNIFVISRFVIPFRGL